MRQVQFVLVCIDLPGATFGGRAGVRLGIQEGKNVVEDVPADAEQVTFRFELAVKGDPDGEAPRFSGPYAQGKSSDRFVYLCWGERRGEAWDGFRRAKVKLGHLTWSHVEAALRAGTPIRATIRASDAKGEPVAATVPAESITWAVRGE